MTGLPPAAVRQLTMPEVGAYAELAEADNLARRLAGSRARARAGRHA